MLVGIPSERAPKFWGVCAPMVNKAILSTNCDFEINDVYKQILSKDAQLWAWIDNDEITACFITAILTHPKCKVCSVPLIGGKGLRIWRDGVDETLGRWAKTMGCSYLEGYARPGWLRILKNWFTVSTTIRRKL